MSNTIVDNNDKINTGKRNIDLLERKKQTALTKAARLKKELEKELEKARAAELEQNKIRRKNRTHAMIQLATSIIKYFPVLAEQEKNMISASDFAVLNNAILSQIDNSKKNALPIDWNCKLVNSNNDTVDTKCDTNNKSENNSNETNKDNEELSAPNDVQQYDTAIPKFDQLNVLHNASESQKEYIKDAWAEISRVLQTCQNSDNFVDVLNLISYYKSADKPSLIIDDFNKIRAFGLDSEKLQRLITLHHK